MKPLKSLSLILALAALAGPSTALADNNPVAAPEAVVTSGDMRFTVLTPQMIRMEWRSGADKSWTDDATFAVINRRLPVPAYTTEQKDGYLYITTDALQLRYRVGAFPATNPASADNLSISMDLNGLPVLWYPGKPDALNLKGTCRTLDSQNGDNKRSELEQGLVSRSGWAIIDDTGTRGDGSKSLLLEPNDIAGFDWLKLRDDSESLDWYFLGYGHHYKQALYDFTLISGKIPLPPLYAFGYWYSKYQRYTSDDFMQLVTEMEQNDLPLDVMVIDTDWHINGWTGWSWNRELIPDPQGLLDWLHNHNLKVTLNLHPAYGVENNEDNYQAFVDDLGGVPEGTTTVEWNLENPRFYRSLFDNIIRPHEDEGVDFWWLDWQQELTSNKVDGLGHTFWCNHVFFNDMALAHPERRAMIFHRWGGLGNHRYQLGFSGDSHSNFATLAFQPYFTATASNVGYGYWGHDLGGHVQDGANNAELFLRWIQFGVFTPLFRTHSTNSDNIERRMWKYSNFPLMKQAVELRYSLIPYIYTQARGAYDTGVSICRPLYYDYPEVEEAYSQEGEYMFGDDILVNPITAPAQSADRSIQWSTWLPEGSWYDINAGKLLEGNTTHRGSYTQAQIPYFYRAGAVIPNYPAVKNLKTRPENLILQLAPGANGSTSLYEDAGDTEAYKDGEYARTAISQTRSDALATCVISPIEGDFEGKPTQRSYTVKFLGIDSPLEVTLNGSKYNETATPTATGWWYDAAARTLNVNIPSTSTSDRTEVQVKTKESSVASIAAETEPAFDYSSALNLLTVKWPRDFDLSVVDAFGKVMYLRPFSNLAQLSTSSYPEGVYLCRISGAHAAYTYKFKV
ncbi:MAG: DUF5110 domain-containing protein [Bacteroidales bacterium]|nr:DUF5110 domain-containing protein [Bacteroidales bacterium]